MNGQALAKTTSYLLDQGIFMHLAMIPEWVDDKGNLVADIGASKSVTKLPKDHPYELEIIQHGFRHRREDPRSAGKSSGVAYEFFFGDDETMGRRGGAGLCKAASGIGSGGDAALFAPAMDVRGPALRDVTGRGDVTRELFPVMLHPVQYQGGMRRAFLFPWFTWRGDTA